MVQEARVVGLERDTYAFLQNKAGGTCKSYAKRDLVMTNTSLLDYFYV